MPSFSRTTEETTFSNKKMIRGARKQLGVGDPDYVPLQTGSPCPSAVPLATMFYTISFPRTACGPACLGPDAVEPTRPAPGQTHVLL
jgi:hypothetical protein